MNSLHSISVLHAPIMPPVMPSEDAQQTIGRVANLGLPDQTLSGSALADALQSLRESQGLSNLCDIFMWQAARYPEKTALWYETGMTYHNLAGQVLRWSALLQHLAIKPGEHLAVCLPNHPDFVVCMLVAARLGLVLVPLSSALPAKAILHACAAAQAQHILTTSALLSSLLQSLAEAEHTAEGGAPVSSHQALSGLWLSTDSMPDLPAQILAMRHCVSLPTALAAMIPDQATPIPSSGKMADAYILTMTSGSTGEPKPIVLRQETKFQRALAGIRLYDLKSADVTLAATPLYHSLAERLVLMPLLTGGTVVLMPHFSPEQWVHTVAQRQVSFTMAVSSQLKSIAALLQSHDPRVASMRCLVSSSAALDAKLKAELIKQFQADFHECYGASEIAIASNLDPATIATYPQAIGSVGKPAPGVALKIIDDQGQALAVGQVGEIVCKTPMLFGGYFNRPQLTAKAMWGDYFRTGDLGRLDADGLLYFCGRLKDLIISGGINIYPQDVEQVVNAFSGVQESAAFAYPDARLGEVVAVALVAKPCVLPPAQAGQATHVDLRGLRFFCSEHLADFQQPRKWFVIDALPKNAMGKLVRQTLIQSFQPVSDNPDMPF